MKKTVIIILLALLLAIGSFAGYSYYKYENTDEKSVPQSNFTVNGTNIKPSGYNWNSHVLNFSISSKFKYKNFTNSSEEITGLGTFENNDFIFVFPQGYNSILSVVSENNKTIYNGDASLFDPTLINENGKYNISLESEKKQEQGKSYGIMYYTAEFILNIPPPPAPNAYAEISKQELQQGEILAVRLMYLPDGIEPTIETELGTPVFTKLIGDDNPWATPVNNWQALVPVSNLREPGEYSIKILADEEIFAEETVNILKFDFLFQNLQIDTSSSTVSEASSPKAYAEFREKIYPLRQTSDSVQYWEGVFQWPATGRITTEFGTERITNGVQSTWRAHYGMDIAAPEGTSPEDYVGSPVTAPNNGRVVFAEYLLNTGYTIVIEHGGGLKSYYFHLSEIAVEEDQMVSTGELIGKVGSTGYSTGPHLHYELRIGDEAVNPMMMFEEDAALYQ